MNTKTLKTVFCLIGAFAGILSLIFGIVALSTQSFKASIAGTTFDTTPNTYGADFYTDIYRMINGVAGNTFTINETIEEATIIIASCIGFVLIVFGLFLIAFFGYKVIDLIKKDPAPISRTYGETANCNVNTQQNI